MDREPDAPPGATDVVPSRTPEAVRPVSSGAAFAPLAELLEEIRGTSATSVKVAHIARYLATLAHDEDLRCACTFLSGRAFPLGDPRRLMVGWAAIGDVLQSLTRVSGDELQAVYLTHGDLGDTAADLLARHPQPAPLFTRPLILCGVGEAFRAIAAAQGASSRRSKMEAFRALLLDATPVEARYLIKIMTSDMRVGAREGLLLPAIASAFGRNPHAVRRAALLVADVGEVAVTARAGTLDRAALIAGRPFRFMLASPLETPAEAFEGAGPPLLVEDKYDGIRVQVHRTEERLVIFSRTLDDVTAAFPELHAPLAALGQTFILDGEVIAWKGSRPLGFGRLQQRLRRKTPGALLREIPVVLMAFDLLHLNSQDLLTRPLVERRAALEALPLGGAVRVSTASVARTPEDLDARFRQARDSGNEGIVMKRPDSPYEPGRRGRLWFKWKPGVATLDVVVVAAEYGHGKRAGVLSDYTFAVRDRGGLATIGKAYSGLTDAEIARLSDWFLAHTREDLGFVRVVEPRIVLEVAFDTITVSNRHDSGFALRFPRIARIRDDKPPAEINTLDDVRALHSRLSRAATTSEIEVEVGESAAARGDAVQRASRTPLADSAGGDDATPGKEPSSEP